MSNYEKWKDRYDRNWCTKEQLARLVALKVLTQEQYEIIIEEKSI